MRIAIVSDWFAPRRGGIEAQLLQLAERLGERGDEVDVITSTPEAVSGAHHRVRALRLLRLPKVDVAVSPRLVGALREALVTRYDVVHAHVSVVSPVGYIGAAVARSLDLPTLVTFHSILRYKRAALRAANAVVGLSRSRVRWTAVSELVATQVRHGLPDADVSVLPNGIDFRFWSIAADAPPPAHAGVRIVCATRLHAKKRPLQLIRAFARAASRVAMPMHLVIAGDGPERARLEREVVALGVHRGRARVELRPWMTADDLRILYGEADAFASAAVREAFNIAALEARAAGLPVIAMTAAGSSEFLESGRDALLCSDDDALATSIECIARDSDLRRRLSVARTSVERYDWSRVIDLHHSAYERAISGAFAGTAVAASA